MSWRMTWTSASPFRRTPLLPGAFGLEFIETFEDFVGVHLVRRPGDFHFGENLLVHIQLQLLGQLLDLVLLVRGRVVRRPCLLLTIGLRRGLAVSLGLRGLGLGVT